MNPSIYKLAETCQIPGLALTYEKFFGPRSDGCFVEVGAFDGEYVSNTSGLADIGWTGFYIEPVPQHALRCRERHARNPRVTVSQCAIGSSRAQVDIHVGGPLSTIRDESRENFLRLEWARECFQQAQTVRVQQVTLDEYLRACLVQPGFELLVVDVEGYEWEVLKNFDLAAWRPQMAIVELHDQNDQYLYLRPECLKIVEQFERSGYQSVYKDHSNTIYVSGELSARAHSV